EESSRIFGRTWQLVAHEEDLGAAGSFVTVEIAGEPILVVRGDDGKLRALSNVCRHRAGPVAAGSGTCRAFRCGYHGWSYALDGRLLGTPEFDGAEGFRREDVALPAFRADVWMGLVFVTLDPNAPPLAKTLDALADLPDRRPLPGMRRAHRKEWIVECNWKVYVDNYLEGYHIPIVHPGLFRELDYARYATETKRLYSIQHAPVRTAAPGRLRSGEGDEAEYYWIYPNLMLNVYPDNFSTNVILPLGPERTRTVFEWFFRNPEDPAVRKAVAETVAFSDEIQLEDIAICEAVQRGLRSRTYDRGRYSVRRENGVHHFHRLYAAAMNGDAPRVASREPRVAGGSDSAEPQP
ncbi:MAG TPA: SRPBCC family protein, partial [Thermoanaerobaculia bacterium]|nr:SRPBCC family protein [Thermoanaerobaculia bacterium]